MELDLKIEERKKDLEDEGPEDDIAQLTKKCYAEIRKWQSEHK